MKHFVVISVLFFSLSQIILPQSSFSVQMNAGPIFFYQGDESTGYGASGTLLYLLSEKFHLTFRAGYLNWSTEGETPLATLVSDYYGIPFSAGAKYYFVKTRVSPYAEVSAGKFFMHVDRNVEYNSNIRYNSDQQPSLYLSQPSGSSNGYIFGLGVGLNYELTDNLNLDFRGMLQHPEVASEYVEISAGLGVGL